jgi:hypothetical protein
MFSRGWKESVTPKRAAVAGMSCISPCAPAWLTAAGRPEDSTEMIARTSAGETRVPIVAVRISIPCRSAIWRSVSSRGEGGAAPGGPLVSATSASSSRPELAGDAGRDMVPVPGERSHGPAGRAPAPGPAASGRASRVLRARRVEHEGRLGDLHGDAARGAASGGFTRLKVKSGQEVASSAAAAVGRQGVPRRRRPARRFGAWACSSASCSLLTSFARKMAPKTSGMARIVQACEPSVRISAKEVNGPIGTSAKEFLLFNGLG